MDFLRDLRVYAEAVFPGLAVLETEILVAAALSIPILVVLLLVCLCRGRRRGRYVCLLGLGDSGKTLLFMRLTYGHFMRTQNSIKENKALFELSKMKGKPVELVDIPGDERVRERLFSKYRDSIRAIVLVVDSVSFPQEIRNVAELAYDLLSEKALHKGRIPVMVACNKQDLTLARTPEAIRTQLQKEINNLRSSRAAKLASIEGPKKQNTVPHLGRKGRDFQFSDLPFAVEFVGCSARGRGEEESSAGEIDDVKGWLEQNC